MYNTHPESYFLSPPKFFNSLDHGLRQFLLPPTSQCSKAGRICQCFRNQLCSISLQKSGGRYSSNTSCSQLQASKLQKEFMPSHSIDLSSSSATLKPRLGLSPNFSERYPRPNHLLLENGQTSIYQKYL